MFLSNNFYMLAAAMLCIELYMDDNHPIFKNVGLFPQKRTGPIGNYTKKGRQNEIFLAEPTASFPTLMQLIEGKSLYLYQIDCQVIPGVYQASPFWRPC